MTHYQCGPGRDPDRTPADRAVRQATTRRDGPSPAESLMAFHNTKFDGPGRLPAGNMHRLPGHDPEPGSDA